MASADLVPPGANQRTAEVEQEETEEAEETWPDFSATSCSNFVARSTSRIGSRQAQWRTDNPVRPPERTPQGRPFREFLVLRTPMSGLPPSFRWWEEEVGEAASDTVARGGAPS